MSSNQLFSPRILACLVAAIAVTFAASILLSTQGGDALKTEASVGSNSYSHSAVGYAGFYEVLRRQGKPAERAQNDPLAKLGRNGLLVLAEPSSFLASDKFRNEINSAKNILLILPKWTGVRSEERKDWISSAEMLPAAVPQSVFSLVSGDGRINRVAATDQFFHNAVGHDPTVSGTLQLIRGSKMNWIAGTPDGMILGEIREQGRRIWVLSDPDVLENHGIGKGDNAALALDIIEQLADTNAAIVFDETVHGFVAAPKPPPQINLGFPYNLLALQGLVALALLLLATTSRFGAPEILPLALGAGKRGLIANAALLIDFGGHHAALLKRFAQTVIRDTARQMRAPKGLEGPALMNWLDRASKARSLPDNASSLLSVAETASSHDLPRLFATARALYFWKKELLHGTARRSDHD